MFPARFFARRMFAPRYFANVGAAASSIVGHIHTAWTARMPGVSFTARKPGVTFEEVD
jgi:hypothetical protein